MTLVVDSGKITEALGIYAADQERQSRLLTADEDMTPEQKARQNIDQLLTAAGWTIQHRDGMNLGASQGVAVREFQMASGPADYLLFIDRKAAGAVEAKPEGTTLGGVSEQTERYLTGNSGELSVPSKPFAVWLRKHRD